MDSYRALFRSELDPETVKEIREATNGGYALGGKRFLAQIEAAAGRRVTRGKAGRPPGATDAVPEEQAELF